jgi:hypothetical protein
MTANGAIHWTADKTAIKPAPTSKAGQAQAKIKSAKYSANFLK